MNDSKSGHFLSLKNSKLLQMPENLLGRAVADAVPLVGHALHYAGGFPRACGSVGAPGGSRRFEHEFAGRVVGADDGCLAPARFEASARLVE